MLLHTTMSGSYISQSLFELPTQRSWGRGGVRRAIVRAPDLKKSVLSESMRTRGTLGFAPLRPRLLLPLLPRVASAHGAKTRQVHRAVKRSKESLSVR